MGRRFVTRSQIDVIADRGETVLEVDDRTTVTDLAREHAMQRGVAVVRVPAGGGHAPAPAPAAVDSGGAADTADTRAQVRSAVLAALGEVPAGLDAALDRVLGPKS
jgi:hypothetical protein